MAKTKPLTALDYFRAGHDTMSIKSILKITEAEALEQLSRERSALLGRPDPYRSVSPSARGPSGLIAYAGQA